MHGIVSLLDERHYRQVETLWAKMAEKFGVSGVNATPFPHFSYHIARAYDLAEVMAVLERWARKTAVFTIKTSGLGVFTGPDPVIYVPVARAPALCRLHEILWQELDACSTGGCAYYAPDAWFPHITLGFGDITGENLAAILAWLNEQELAWEICVNNLAFIRDPGKGAHALHRRFDFVQ